MSPFKRCCVIAALMLLVAALVYSVVDTIDARDEGISIKWVEYNADDGKISFSGTTSSDYVNVTVVGNGFESQVKPCRVVNGSFSGTFLIGALEPGQYQAVFKSPEYSTKYPLTVSGTPLLTISSVEYDNTSGKVSFSGTTSSDYVNVTVVGNGFESQVKPCRVVNGSFSGTFLIGALEPGSYRLVVKSPEGDRTRVFEVSNEPIIIKSIVFDSSDARVIVMGVLYSNKITGLSLTAPNDQEYNAKLWVDNDHSFVSYFNVGRLVDNGVYQLKITSSESILRESVYTDGTSDIETITEGNVLRDNGCTLVRYSGTTDQYRIPSTVTRVLEGAFDNCSISTFVLDRDVHWELKEQDGMTYPFQSSNLANLVIKEGVTDIPDYLFAKSGISNVELPSSIKTVGKKSFYDCDNIVYLTVRDNNCLTYLGDYSFSYNSGLTRVHFGSSAEGYQCDLGMAAFLFSSNIRTVELDDGFYLKTIGSLCFTKELVKGYNANPLYAINFNASNGIVIPKEVEEIGFLAFSTMTENRNVVPSIYPNSEPSIGTFTYNGDGYISYGGMRGLSGNNTIISFETGSQVTSIGIAAFAGYEDVKTIDLSNCSRLSTIQRNAFAACLNDGVLYLPPNIEELYESFRLSSGTINGGIPDGLKICDNALGNIKGVVTVGSNSSLVKWSDDVAGSITELDLSGASNLEYVSTGCNKTILPAGVFEGNINVGRLKNDVGPEVNGDVVLIKDTTTFLNWNMLSKELVCANNNPYFKDDGSAIYFERQGICKLLQVKQSDVFALKEGAHVREGIMDQTILDLTIYSGSKMEGGSLSSCDCLQTLRIIGPVDIVMMESALSGLNAYPIIYVSNGTSDSDVMKLSVYGEVQFYMSVNGKTVNAPAIFNGSVLHYTVNDSQSLDVDCTLEGVLLSSSGVLASLNGNEITLKDVHSECYVWFVDTKDLAGKISITLDANGGYFGNDETTMVSVREGSVLSVIDSIPTRNLNAFRGWSSDPNGILLTNDYRLVDNCTLYAQWSSRGPIVVADDKAAIIYSGDSVFSTSILNNGSTLTLTAEPKMGYELFEWIVNGAPKGPASDPLVLGNIVGDTTVSLSFRYYSPSSGLNGTTNRGLPTADESDDLVLVTELGGHLDMTTAIWKGHASVPLIVDDRIYFRAGSRLYATESDTGYIIASVMSAEANDYYHQLGYGAGVIIDYKTGKAYDLDLNQLFVLPNTVYGAEYYNGLFYTSGKDVYSFTAVDDNPNIRNEQKEMTFVGHIEDVFSSYGFSRSVFVDHYMYRVVATGYERGIAAMDLNTGAVQVRYLESIRSMYLDDGWISYNDGYIYMPGYTTGLFGAVATDGSDTLAYIDVDGLIFGNEDHYTFTETGFVSETLFYGNKAYIYAGSQLYSFDLVNGKISKTNPRHLDNLVIGHGSMVMDVSYDENGEGVVYLYIIPYTSFNVGLTVIEDKNGVLTSHQVYGLPQNYNSQAVRADIDGRVIWYNDSGHIYDYTTPDKNVYFFFIEDGKQARWYEAHGRNAAEALKSLGTEIISVDDYKRVVSVFGNATDKPYIQVLKQNTPADISSNLMSYSWVKLNDLYDRSYDVCHYYRISASQNDIASTYSYLKEDGTVGTYTFVNNIGNDRSVLETPLVPGTDVSTIRYYDGTEELRQFRTIFSNIVGASWDIPSLIKNGTNVVWKDSDGNVVKALSDLNTNGSDISLYGYWANTVSGVRIDVTVNETQSGKIISVSSEEYSEQTYLKAIIRTSTGFIENQYILQESNRWGAEIDIDINVDAALLYILRSSEQSFNDNLGYKLLVKEAGL